MTTSLHSHPQSRGWTEPGDTSVTGWLRRLLIVGMAWLVIGMAVMPAGVSYNPGKAYQDVLALTMWLPVIILSAMRPQRLLAFCTLPLMPWVIVLLAWGWISLSWTHAARPADEAARNLSILLFLVACQWVFNGDQRRTKWLLIGCSLVLAVVAVFDMIHGALHPAADGRLTGIGVMANANLAAAGMGAGLLWLWPWRFDGWRGNGVKWLAISALALFVLLTFTRSAWAALFVSLIVVVLCRGSRRAWLYAGLLCALGAIGVAAGLHLLLQRGWSLRPQIFAQSVKLFMQHPWRGLGQGSPFQIKAGKEILDHAHNMFAQLAIELGLPALLLWMCLWLALGWRAWRHRHETVGLVVLGLWVFGTIAVQFDLPHLLDSPRPGWLITWLPLALSTTLGRPVAVKPANDA
ncbi:O-antigen ligase family protein [Dyella jejuensis]|uniref:O-antigen ligase family protein n=1 Tax=Dyella jejuensis TaxID=1432009 RepID=A0ABW8JPE7_9GAMM